MAIAVEMPKMSDTMEEGVLVSWLVDEGVSVAAGDIIAQVETDKATMDLEVYDDGVLLKKVAEEGAAVPIGGLIAILGSANEDISEILSKYGSNGTPADSKKTAPKETSLDAEPERPPEGPATVVLDQPPAGDGRVKASPLARRMAREGDLNIRMIKGTGPEGRIIKRDVEAVLSGKVQPAPRPAAPARPAEVTPPMEAGGYQAVPISQMRKAIARRLGESKFGSPHFYLTIDLDMERTIAARAVLNKGAENEGRPKISFNDLVVKACASALKQHPWVNSSYLEYEGEIRLHNDIHVAVAVAVDEGLVTPVIRHADRKGLLEIAAEVADLAGRARERKLALEEMEGSTFTTSNLGMLGIEQFTAIINPPNSCILAIGTIRDEAVVRDGEILPGKRMSVTLSCDHRVVDGATGARFLATFKELLEAPERMLL